ncbi:MAG: SigB/SigF/SigG family RNA polymerase sigma factor [Bacillota bacterium]|jgi:RNA polymerase sporulation-specific sigma factor
MMGATSFNMPRYPLLSQDEQLTLIILAQNGDIEAKEKLVKANIRLIYSVAKRFVNCGKEMEDLFQIGAIGLLKAIDKFDASYQVAFSTYAVPMILGEIRRYIRDDSPINISRSLKENASLIRKKREEWLQKEGKEPSVSQLSEELNLEQEKIVAALEASQPIISIHETIYQDDGDAVYLLDKLKDSDRQDEESEENKLLEDLNIKTLLEQLPPRLHKLIYLRYFLDKTQQEVAVQLGISQVQVSRLEKQAFTIIKQNLSSR